MNPSNSKSLKIDVIETKPVAFVDVDVAGPEAPIGREGHCACAVGDKLYVFGGVCQSDSDDCVESSDLYKLDMGNNTWTRIAAKGDAPPPRSAAVMNAVGNKLILFGGLSQYSGWFNDVYSYNIDENCWTKLTVNGTGPSGRDKLTSAAIGNKIYYFGGFGPKGSFDSEDDLNEEDDDDEYEDIEGDEIQEIKQQQRAADMGWFNDLYILDTSTNSWNQPMQMNLGVPTMRAAHGMCSMGQYLVIFGGRDTEGRQNDVHIFDTVTRKWKMDKKEQGCPPDRRSFHTMIALNDDLALVFGGRAESNDHFNDCHVFDRSSTTWYKVPLKDSVPPSRGCHSCTMVNGKVVIYGGSAKFMPEIQHCLQILNDVHIAEVSEFVNAVSAVPSGQTPNGH